VTFFSRRKPSAKRKNQNSPLIRAISLIFQMIWRPSITPFFHFISLKNFDHTYFHFPQFQVRSLTGSPLRLTHKKGSKKINITAKRKISVFFWPIFWFFWLFGTPFLAQNALFLTFDPLLFQTFWSCKTINLIGFKEQFDLSFPTVSGPEPHRKSPWGSCFSVLSKMAKNGQKCPFCTFFQKNVILPMVSYFLKKQEFNGKMTFFSKKMQKKGHFWPFWPNPFPPHILVFPVYFLFFCKKAYFYQFYHLTKIHFPLIFLFSPSISCFFAKGPFLAIWISYFFEKGLFFLILSFFPKILWTFINFIIFFSKFYEFYHFFSKFYHFFLNFIIFFQILSFFFKILWILSFFFKILWILSFFPKFYGFFIFFSKFYEFYHFFSKFYEFYYFFQNFMNF